MHILHRIAVEAESISDAKDEVEDHIERGFFDWSDWAKIGGRWNDEFTVVNYAENPEKFTELLEKAKEGRAAEVKGLFEAIDLEELLQSLSEYNGEEFGFGKLGMDAYRLATALEVASGHSKPDSYFYDLTDGGTGDKYVKGRIEKNPTQQYLVAVDFHF